MSADRVDSSKTRRLTTYYITALCLVAVLSILGQVLVQRELRNQKGDSHVVNIAGRQRMLSQKLGKAAAVLQAVGISPDERRRRIAELRDVRTLWSESHERLKHGDPILGLPGTNSLAVNRLFTAIEAPYRTMLTGVSQVLTEGSNRDDGMPDPALQAAGVAQILAHEDGYLQAMDAIVSQYEREAEQRVLHLRWLELSLLGLMLLVLAVEGVFIFRPAVRQIRDMFVALNKTLRDLEIAKESAEAAHKSKSQFLANMSHEIRTPLSAVTGLTEVVLRTDLTSEQGAHLEAVRDSANRLLVLLNDTLDFAKIEAGKLELEYAPFDLQSTLTDALAPLALRAEAQGLQFRLEFGSRIPRQVVGDAKRLSQVLINLVDNAVKFTSQGSVRVAIDAQEIAPQSIVVSCSVADSGIGISLEKQRTIFEAFTQEDSSTTRRYGGTGLGLSIAQQLVELMGGKLAVESNVGRGSTFSFDVRFGTHHPPTAVLSGKLQGQSRPAERAAVRPIRVLLVDDTEANRQLVTAILSARGHAVVSFDSSMEAAEMLARESFDVALFDLRMPAIDGFELTSRVRQQEQARGARRLPIIALTADTLADARDRCIGAGMDDYLPRPFQIPTFLECVERWGTRYSDSPRDVIDLDVALARLEGNTALWQALIRLFLNDAPILLVDMRAGLDELNSRKLSLAAHRFRGLVSNFSAHDVVTIAEHLELDSEQGDFAAAVARYDSLVALCEDLRTTLAEQLTAP